MYTHTHTTQHTLIISLRLYLVVVSWSLFDIRISAGVCTHSAPLPVSSVCFWWGFCVSGRWGKVKGVPLQSAGRKTICKSIPAFGKYSQSLRALECKGLAEQEVKYWPGSPLVAAGGAAPRTSPHNTWPSYTVVVYYTHTHTINSNSSKIAVII